MVIHLPRGLKGPKRRLDPQDRNRHRAEANDPSFTSGATAALSVVEKAATQGIRALESAIKIDGSHVVCPPTFIATRQRCGGACREELGGPWVAFFLTTLLCSSVLSR